MLTNNLQYEKAFRPIDVTDGGITILASDMHPLGFRTPPRVDLPIGVKRRNGNGAGGNGEEKRHGGGSGHDLSASNPYGKRKAGDIRQFTY